MQPQSSESTGQTCRSTTTCGRSRRKATTPSISSAAASLAKTSALPEKVPGLQERGPVFGTILLGSFAQFGHDGWSLKTSQLSLLEGSEPFSETWPKSGLMRNGTAYRLQPLVRRTDANASGSLPFGTPTANEKLATAYPTPNMGERFRRRHGGNLLESVANQMWPTTAFQQGLTEKPTHHVPTPTASDHIERESTSSEVLNFDTNKSVSLDRWVRMWPTPKASAAGPDFAKMGRSKTGISLATAAAMYPTPTVQDASNNGGPSQYERNSLPLNAVAGGSLNPLWVEWLMGFPLGWTALDASATPLSRKSLRSSAGRSLKRKRG